jgi:hypothetical protein
MGEVESISGARLVEELDIEDVDSAEGETKVNIKGSTTPAPDHKKPRLRYAPPTPANYL